MNCFYHPQTPAIGLCRSCQKGLCTECASDLKNGLACKNKCETEVMEIISMINRNKRAYGTAGDSEFKSGFFWMIIGGLSIFLGINSRNSDAFFFFGIVFLVIAAWHAISGYKLRKINKVS